MTLGQILFCWMPIGLVKLIARALPVSLIRLKNGNVLRMHCCLGVLVKARPFLERDAE
mgnify:CR=1 FL=1